MIAIGKIVKAHGIGGDVKITSFMDSPSSFTLFKGFYVKETFYKATKIRVMNDFVLVKLSGIDTMNDAETLRDQIVYCKEEDLPSLTEGRYYINDILGCTIIAGEEQKGKITDVLQYGSADVVVFRFGTVMGMFPWVKDLNVVVDKEKKLFRVEPKRFDEVVSYED